MKFGPQIISWAKTGVKLNSASAIICAPISNFIIVFDKMPQQRVVLSFMGFLSIAVSYSMRACLSVAITEMTEPIKTTNTVNQSMNCGVFHSQASLDNKANTVSDWVKKEDKISIAY